VITIEPYKGFSSALAMVNESAYGLVRFVPSNLRYMFEAYEHLEVGGSS
jgi:hypothetical protein